MNEHHLKTIRIALISLCDNKDYCKLTDEELYGALEQVDSMLYKQQLSDFRSYVEKHGPENLVENDWNLPNCRWQVIYAGTQVAINGNYTAYRALLNMLDQLIEDE